MFTTPEVDHFQELLTDFCNHRVPMQVRDKAVLQFRVDNHDIVLFEKRAPFQDDMPWSESGIAKFRWTETQGTWRLLFSDRNGRWHHYDRLAPHPDLEALLDEVQRDVTRIFWG